MNEMIAIDSARGKELGFTSDRFTTDSYLWEFPERIMVSLITSKAKGNFKALVAAIHAQGKAVAVPTPLGRMQRIVEKNGYVHTLEPVEDAGVVVGGCDVWTCSP
jgi:hypothetical protein